MFLGIARSKWAKGQPEGAPSLREGERMKKSIIFVLYLVLLCLAGCSASAPITFTEEKTSTDSEKKQEWITETSGIETIGNGTRLHQNLSPLVTLDAVPDDHRSNGEAKVITARLMKIHPEFILDILPAQDISECEQRIDFELPYDDGTVFSSYSYPGGYYITCSSILGYTRTENNLALNLGPSRSPNQNPSWDGDNKDFHFASRMDAEEAVRGTLEKAGFKELEELYCFSVDHEQLEAIENQMADEDSDDRLSFVKKGHWTEEDDYYYFVFRYAIGGIPVQEESYFTSDNRFFPGSYIDVAYGKDGIVYLLCFTGYRILSEETVKILPAESMVDGLKEKYSEILAGEEICLNSVELIYLTIDMDPEKMEFTLIPAWRFADTITQNKYEVYFNAMTGEEIVRE